MASKKLDEAAWLKAQEQAEAATAAEREPAEAVA